MIIDAEDTSGSWKGDYYYGFMIDDREDTPCPVELLIEIREMIKERPPTASTIRLDMFMDEKRVRYVTKDMVYLAGSWVDPYYNGSLTRIVNPKYEHVHKYSDILTWCECDQALLQTTRSKKSNFEVNEHENCPIYQKQYTNAEINQKRASLIRTMLRLNYPATSVIPRFGLTRDSIETDWTRRMGVDMTEEKKNGTRLMSNTFAHLVYRHSTEKIGKAFGLSYAEVGRKVKVNTGVDPQEAYEYRRWG